MNYQTPTLETHGGLDRAFNFFNERLFDSRLPEAMITIQRKRNVRGYYWDEQFHHRTMDDKLPEIAMNPDSMGRTIEEVLSTLVHEMVHHWQFVYGKPGKNGHHNREWADKMDALGLEPCGVDGNPETRTGRKVTHTICEGGPFAVACAELVATGFDLPWFTRPVEARAKKKDPSKVKHTCPDCQQNVWGKIGIRVVCGDCEQMMEAAQ